MNSSPTSEKGAILPLFMIVLLIGGVILAVFLVQNQQIFRSQAGTESAGENARYQTWNGVKTLGEMRAELRGKRIPGPNNSVITSFDDKSPYQTLKAYQYLPALRAQNVADQRLFNCTLNVGNLDNMSSVPQPAEVGKEIAVTITQKWEDELDGYGCATGSIVPKVYIGETKPENVFIQDWGSGKIGIFDGTDHKGVPTNQKDAKGNVINLPGIYDDLLDGNPTWNADHCFARLDVDPNNQNEKDDRGRQLFRLGAGRFVQHGTGGGWYETFVRSCYFTPTKPGNYIVEGHMTHGRHECSRGARGENARENNLGDLVAQCRITVNAAGQVSQTPSQPSAQQPTSLSAPGKPQIECLSESRSKITWPAVPGATGYRVRFDKNPGTSAWFDNVDRDRGDYANDLYPATSIEFDMVPGTPYKFWVHAYNNNVTNSDASENVTFSCGRGF